MMNELAPIFKEWLSVNYYDTLDTTPKNDHDLELLFDMYPVMQGTYHNREEDTFSITSEGLLRRFFEWCITEPKTPEQGRAHMLIIKLLMEQVLGPDIETLWGIADKWRDSHKKATGAILNQL